MASLKERLQSALVFVCFNYVFSSPLLDSFFLFIPICNLYDSSIWSSQILIVPVSQNIEYFTSNRAICTTCIIIHHKEVSSCDLLKVSIKYIRIFKVEGCNYTEMVLINSIEKKKKDYRNSIGIVYFTFREIGIGAVIRQKNST